MEHVRRRIRSRSSRIFLKHRNCWRTVVLGPRECREPIRFYGEEWLFLRQNLHIDLLMVFPASFEVGSYASPLSFVAHGCEVEGTIKELVQEMHEFQLPV